MRLLGVAMGENGGEFAAVGVYPKENYDCLLLVDK
jgi:hypothetical protein